MAFLPRIRTLFKPRAASHPALPAAPESPQTPEGTGAAESAFANRLSAQLLLPIAPSPEENCRGRIQDHGQFLARQDRWEELGRAIRSADTRKAATHCGMPHAALMSLGARSDVVQSYEQTKADGLRPNLEGIEALEDVLQEFPDDYAIAEIVAQAHMDIGWLWRGSGWSHDIPAAHQRLFTAHFDRAAEILHSFDRAARQSPLLAAAQAALVVARPEPALQLADKYERLIDLNPANTGPMRTLGSLLLPRWFGSYEALELEARRTAARTQHVWGNGAYAWVYLDALRIDQTAARHLDTEFFIDGLKDILYLQPDQHIANQLAAFTGVTMAPSRTPLDAPADVRRTRHAIHDSFDMILRAGLHELHPLIWAEADLGPDPGTFLPVRASLMRKGQDCARNAITAHFSRELGEGAVLSFSKSGLAVNSAS